MERYRVYTGPIQNLSEKIKYSCCDPMMARMLVFSSRKPEGDLRVMKPKEQETLSAREKRWLSNARLSVALENTGASAQEVAKNINELLDALEMELKMEKEAMNDGAERTDETK